MTFLDILFLSNSTLVYLFLVFLLYNVFECDKRGSMHERNRFLYRFAGW